jgi:hypothetical protein
LRAPNSVVPFPCNVALGPGDRTKQQMPAPAHTEPRVTRFHRVRPVHPLETVVTGMTRDGTFLIARGERVGSAENLR